MDDQQGHVIDGTARARQWRRSKPKAGSGPDAPETRSDAPKSFAGSLLVPADMLPAAVAPDERLSENQQGRAAAPSPPADADPGARATAENGVHQNPFLVPEAAHVEQRSRSTSRRMIAALLASPRGLISARRGASRPLRCLVAIPRWLGGRRRTRLLSLAALTGAVPPPTVPKVTPRGSAQLAPDQPLNRRARSASMTRLHKRPVGGRMLGAAVATAAIAAIATLIITRPAGPTSPTGQPTRGVANRAPIQLAGILTGSLNTLARLHIQLHTRVPHTPRKTPAHKRRTPTRAHRTSPLFTSGPSGAEGAIHATVPPTTSTSHSPTSGGQTQAPPTQPQQPTFGAGGLLGPGSSPNG
jgi:hypothetical protein